MIERGWQVGEKQILLEMLLQKRSGSNCPLHERQAYLHSPFVQGDAVFVRRLHINSTIKWGLLVRK
jgi:hypothetical protein